MARIGIILYSLAGGGAERVSVNLSKEFIKLKHDVDFIVARNDGEFINEIPEQASLFHPAKKSNAKSWKRLIRQYTDTYAPYCLLAMMEGAGILAIQATRRLKTKVYVVSHIHFSHHCKHSSRWKERLLMPIAAKWYLPKSDGIIGVSYGVTEDIRNSTRIPKEKTHTIYNPVLTEDFFRKATEKTQHPWLAKERAWITIISAGRLNKQKNYTLLLNSIALVKEKLDIRLIILGQGEELPELKETAKSLKIEKIVDFLGFEENPYKYIAASDIFVLSSNWEGLPTVLIETLAIKTPIISTDCPSGPREILNHGEYGQLVSINNAEEISNAILLAPKKKIDHTKLSKHLDFFRSSNIAKQYLKTMGL